MLHCTDKAQLSCLQLHFWHQTFEVSCNSSYALLSRILEFCIYDMAFGMLIEMVGFNDLYI